MYGAIIGDICGSKYEGSRSQHMNKYVELFPSGCGVTDDTVMTIAVADAFMKPAATEEEQKQHLVNAIVEWGRRYPRAGYGKKFLAWLRAEEHEPYNSFGNGSAMRVSPCALLARSLEEALELAKVSAEVTHNHPEGIKGAQAIAACVFHAKSGASKETIKKYVQASLYPLDKSIAQLHEEGVRGCTCMVTVPAAIQAFLESDNFEDAIRNAISIGGDTDTIAAMTGSIAWSYYKQINDNKLTMEMHCMKEMTMEFIPNEMKKIIKQFKVFCNNRVSFH